MKNENPSYSMMLRVKDTFGNPFVWLLHTKKVENTSFRYNAFISMKLITFGGGNKAIK